MGDAARRKREQAGQGGDIHARIASEAAQFRNALRMALHHVQRPDATAQDLSTATARANRALTLLKHACAESATSTSGRA